MANPQVLAGRVELVKLQLHGWLLGGVAIRYAAGRIWSFRQEGELGWKLSSNQSGTHENFQRTCLLTGNGPLVYYRTEDY
jgi:hypothetical protein